MSISSLGYDSLEVPRFIRYCPECAIDQRQQYGETYWDRLHQLPGVLTCAKHDCWLELSEINPFSQHKCFTAQSVIPQSDQLVARSVEKDETHLTYFATNAQKLLDGERITYAHNDLKTRYKSVLAEQGYATYATGSLSTKQFASAFADHYSSHTLAQFGLDVESECFPKQLAKIMYVKQTKQPVHHLLITKFLGYDIDTLLSRDPKIKPFGDPPWPCVNRVCKYHHKPVIEHCFHGVSVQTREPLGTFTCPECGFCHSRRGIDTKPSDRYEFGLVRSHGHFWKEELKRWWLQYPNEVEKISRRMKCGHTTVIRYAQELGLMESDTPCINRYEDIPTKEKLDTSRIQWQQIIEQHPEITVNELKADHTILYHWLHRHDYDWLIANSPQPKARRGCTLDWEKLDRELSEKIVAVADEMRSARPPVRITRTAIGKKIRTREVLIKRNSHKVPQIAELIDKITETHEQYALRRLDIAVAHLAENGVPSLTRTKLRQAAGVSWSVQTRCVEEKIEELIAAYKPP